MTLQGITSPNWDTDASADAPGAVAVFLHGYGSNERDLVSLASALPQGMRWASLRAPLALGPGAHAWFHITEPGNPPMSAVAAATDEIWAWANASLPAGTPLVPIGFSQGGLMASQLLRTDPTRVLAPVVLGGFVLGEEQPADAQLRVSQPALFSGRGADDQVITKAAVDRTDAWLPIHTTVTARLYPGLAHGIDAQELADVQAFLAEQLGAPQRP